MGNVKLPSLENAPPHSISIVSGAVISVLTCTRLRSVIAGERSALEEPLRWNSAPGAAAGNSRANSARRVRSVTG